MREVRRLRFEWVQGDEKGRKHRAHCCDLFDGVVLRGREYSSRSESFWIDVVGSEEGGAGNMETPASVL